MFSYWCCSDTITVKDINPIIEYTDITVSLEDNGSVSILPQDVVLGYEAGDNYTLDQTGTFNPENMSFTGTPVFLGDDQVTTSLSVGFDFSFFGNAYNTFQISSNGFITFDNSFYNGCCSGQSLPNTSTPNNLIALGWTDLNPSNGGSIKYMTIGTAPKKYW